MTVNEKVRTPDVFRVADILIDHALQVHGDDIAIIAYYGSRAKGIASPTSDLDIFYIPDEGKAGSLCCQFILDGLPYDFWPVSWGMAEEIASARSTREWAVSASLIADAKVLHNRSLADLDRFLALQANIEELTRLESHPSMVERGLDGFKAVLFHLGQMRLAAAEQDSAGLVWSSRRYVQSVVNCLALINQVYFSNGWVGALSEVVRLPIAPVDLQDKIHDIITSDISDDDPLAKLSTADTLAADVRQILRAEQRSIAEPEPADSVFNDFYFFVFEYANKVRSACRRGDAVVAGAAAIQLQEEICQLLNKVEQGFYPAEFNLFGEYVSSYENVGFPDLLGPASTGDLTEIIRRVDLLDERFRAWLTDREITLGFLASEDELQAFLVERDPLPTTG